MNIFTQFFKSPQAETHRKQRILRDLMHREVELTRDIFGPVPKGGKREFFCLDRNTWVWYEEWLDQNGKRQKVTTRYVVRPTEILKSQNGGAYYRLTEKEVIHLEKAVQAYTTKIRQNLYTGRKFTTQ